MSNQSGQSCNGPSEFETTALAFIAENSVSLQVAIFCGFIWGFLCLGFELTEPAWYRKVSPNKTNRNHVVGLVLGLAFKFITIPSCALAAYLTPPKDDVAGALAPMNVYQQVCWGSRGSTVIFELYHFSANMELMVHHGLIIVTMAIIAIFNCPHRGLDLSLGALVSEFPSMAFSFISKMGWAGQNPELDWKLLVAGAVLTLAIRVPSVFLAMAMVPESGIRGGPGSVVFLAYLIYLVYNLNISLRRLKKAKVFQSWETPDRSWDFGIKVYEDLTINSSAFFAGLTLLTIQVLGLAFYSTFESASKPRLTCAAFVPIVPLSFAFAIFKMGGRWERLVKAIMSWLASTSWMDLGTFTRWSVGGWIAWIVFLASIGETPSAHNKNIDPNDIVTSSPLFCEFVQSWQFWVSATVMLLWPMWFVQMDEDLEKYTQEMGVERLPEKRQAKEAARTPEIHIQHIKQEDEDDWTPEVQLLHG